VVAADVVEPDTIVVEVVEDGQAELVSLAVVRLGNSTAGNEMVINLWSEFHIHREPICAIRLVH